MLALAAVARSTYSGCPGGIPALKGNSDGLTAGTGSVASGADTGKGVLGHRLQTLGSLQLVSLEFSQHGLL